MVDVTTEPSPKWRISKACEQCRRRKIRCDGGEPCRHCKQRKSECTYRGFVRQRKRKHELIKSPAEEDSLDAAGMARSKSPAPSRNILHHSVAATHMASPSCIIQLYYGPSSNFSLMQMMYRQLVEEIGDGTNPQPRSEVEEAGPGLDLFSHRRLFFGDLAGSQEIPMSLIADSSPLVFIHPSLASQYLERYMSTLYYLLPFAPKVEYRQRLEQLYNDPRTMSLDGPDVTIMLLMLASGAAMMEEEDRAEFLFRKAKTNAAKFDELVNVQAVQIPLIMIKRARPNSAYLLLGDAVRKALAAGLHKNTHFQAERLNDDVDQKRTTFWSLYYYETWLCFGLGRSSSIPDGEISIPDPTEQPFLLALVQLSRLMCRCAQSIYGQRHDSLLPMWKQAKEIRRGLQAFSRRLCDVMNFGLESSPKSGELGVCQTVLLLLYHHLCLLTFRPFLIFRARWRREGAGVAKNGEKPLNNEQVIPSWLGEASEYSLEAARCIIRYLSDAYEVNKLVREIKYHAFFLESACFTLAFDMMHNQETASKNLPWVKSGLRCLASMLPRNQFRTQVSVTISAIQQMLESVFPGFNSVVGVDNNSNGPGSVGDHSTSFGGAYPADDVNADTLPPQDIGNPSAFFNSLGQNLMMPLGGADASTESNQDDHLADITQADMGWNFDFSTMDLEAFLSIDPTRDMGFTAR